MLCQFASIHRPGLKQAMQLTIACSSNWACDLNRDSQEWSVQVPRKRLCHRLTKQLKLIRY